MKRKLIRWYTSLFGSGGAWQRYGFCFFAGLAAGTGAANFFYPWYAKEAAYYLELLGRNGTLRQEERLRLFWPVFRQRMVQVCVLWLCGLTAYGGILFSLFAFLLGFTTGFVLSVITAGKGLMGLPVFLMTLLPQIFCYLPVCLILLFWGMQRSRRGRIPIFLLILVLTVAGSGLEVWANPVFLKIVF